MSGRVTYSIRKFARDMGGTTLVELAIVLPIFLLIFFGLIDFGRMGAEYVMAEKAMQRAARIAAVRPPACAGVPTAISRGVVAPNTVPPQVWHPVQCGRNDLCKSRNNYLHRQCGRPDGQ